MKKLLSIIMLFLSLFFVYGCNSISENQNKSASETVAHKHTLEYHPESPASFYNDGSETEYYYCTGCNKYFDASGNEITPKLLPRLSTALSLGVNGEIKGDFTVDESEIQIEHISWKYEQISLQKDDIITIHSKNDTSIIYDFFPDTQSNITEEHKVHNDVSNADIDIMGTPNGLYLSISGFEYYGVVIKINDVEYPMNKTSYYDEDIQTYIYGYANIEVNDKVVIIDKDNNIIYDYDDFEDYIKWNIYDYHKGDNDEIIFDYPARYGFEFDRGGDKKISITKIFAPNHTTDVALQFSSERENIPLTGYNVKNTDPEYEETLWYIKHESIINNEDIVNYIENNGFYMYIESANLYENEMFNISDITNNNIIKGDHLTDAHCSTFTDNISIENDYIKVLKDGRYSICYIPSTSTISIFEIANVADAYVLNGGKFISLNKDNDNIVHYEIEVTSEFGETCALTDPNYKMLNVTLDASVDNTCITKHDNNTFTLTKKGTYNLHLNLDDLILKVDFTAAQEEISETNKIIKFYDSNGGQSSAFSQEFVVNPENDQEYCLLNYTVQNGWLALVDMSSGSLENIEGVTLSEGSDVATQLSYFFIITAGTTCNFYYNPATNSLRIVKVQ